MALGPLSPPLATAFYLAMGWGGLWCYNGMKPRLSRAERFPVPLGGIFYSIGAVAHVARRPTLWAGVLGSHELFHLFVVAGVLTHFLFIWRHINAVEPARVLVAGNRRPATRAYRSAGTA